jgi:hypothetical protein
MHGAMKRGVVMAVVTAVVASAVACADKAPQATVAEGRLLKPKKNDTVTVTANCTSDSQVDVALDKWVVDVNKNGEVTFLLNSTSTPVADVTVLQKSTGKWPFSDTTSIKPGKGDGNGRNKGKAKADTGKYQYNLRVVCGTGATARTVVIDPDIFVD